MLPTLLIGDHLFVNKFIYGIKLPFSDWRCPGIREPERGDVVVFTVAQRRRATYPGRSAAGPAARGVREAHHRPAGRPHRVPRGPRLRERRSDRAATHRRDLRRRRRHAPRRERGDARRPLLPHPRRSERDFPSPVDSRHRRARAATSCSATTATTRRTAASGARVRLAEIKGPAFILYWSWDFNGSWARAAESRSRCSSCCAQDALGAGSGERVHVARD